MNRLRTVIVDDEQLALDLLRSYLAEIPEIEIVAQCTSGREAVAVAAESNPDLMFLDIQMPGMNGFEVVKELQADVAPYIIFATAYEKYALDAFDAHVVDYLVKPYDEERLARAVQRAVDACHSGASPQESKPRILGAVEEIARQVNQDSESSATEGTGQVSFAGQDHKLVIKDRDSILLVAEAAIDWIDAAGDYMCVHAEGQTHILRSTMKELESQLSPDLFKRVHRSTMVNLERVQQIIPQAKGEYILELDIGTQLKVSRNYRDVIKGFLNKK